MWPADGNGWALFPWGGELLFSAPFASRAAQGQSAANEPKKDQPCVNRDGNQNGIAPQFNARSRFDGTLSGDDDHPKQEQEVAARCDVCFVGARFAKFLVCFSVGGMLRGELVFFAEVRMLAHHLCANGCSGFLMKGCEVRRLVCLLCCFGGVMRCGFHL